MRLNLLNRRVHYWITVFIAIPTLIILCSGILLQVKKQWTWVQPKEHKGTGAVPKIDLEGILASVKKAPGVQVSGWNDVKRLDIRPGKAVAKVTLENDWEVQVDLGTGDVLQSAYRRSDLIESIHDGSFFGGDISKLGVFLTNGIALLVMWITGLWMFWLPFSVKLKRKKTIRTTPQPNKS